MEHVLTYMTFIPVAGMVAVLLLPSRNPNLTRWVSAAFTVPPLLMACWLYANFDPAKAGLQFVERASWIPATTSSISSGSMASASPWCC
jgi:NADH-quinone oxidoreductase subunit M